MKKTLVGAQIGFGYIAEKGHLPAYRSGATARPFDIAAVADVCEAGRVLAKSFCRMRASTPTPKPFSL